jgi:hypothetical protein
MIIIKNIANFSKIQPKKENKTKKFAVRIDKSASSTLLTSFVSCLKKQKNLKIEEDTVFGLFSFSSLDITKQNDIVVFNVDYNGLGYDVELITNEELPVILEGDVKVYTLSKDLFEIVDEINKLNKSKEKVKKQQSESPVDILIHYYSEREEINRKWTEEVQVHHHFVRIGCNRYNLLNDCCGKYFVFAGEKIYLE